MGKRAHQDSAETYEAIVSAALDQILKQGGLAVSLRSVSRAAGLSLGTVQYYFKSREVLFETCIDRWTNGVVSLVEPHFEIVRNSEQPIETLVLLVQAVYRLSLANRHLLQLRHIDTANRSELSPRILERVIKPLLQHAGSVLEERLGGEADDWRLRLRSIEFLIGRYAGLSDYELAVSLGPNRLSKGQVEVEEHLAEVVRALFFFRQDSKPLSST